MTSRVIPVAPFALAVFGATGDLAMRKLFPALWRRVQAGQAPAESKIIGIARAEIDRDEFRRGVADNLKKASAIDDESDPRLRDFLAGIDYVAIDAEGADGWDSLAAALDGAPRPTLFYLAVAPALAAPICRRLRENGFFADGDARLVLEKPFGRDLESARELNRTVRAACAESQIYRIDHYLGKETVQNLMALRFANALFEPLWNARAIDHVQITVAESIGVKGRGGYYDRAGAARDMLQNHSVATALPRRDGAARALHRRRRARRKTKSAVEFAPVRRRRRQSRYRPIRGRTRLRFVFARFARRGRRKIENRNIRRRQMRNRQLALGGNAVLFAHRQAAGRAHVGDRGLLPRAAAFDFRRLARLGDRRRRRRKTRSLCACSRARA